MIVPGGASNNSPTDPEYFDLFDVDSLAANQRVLGVEADINGDGVHSAFALIDGTSTRSTTTFDDNNGTVDRIVGELPESQASDPLGLNRHNNGAAGETEDAYVRMAWATGGAAWDIGILDDDAGTPSDQTSRENALRDAFVDSLGRQIVSAHSAGKVFVQDEVLLALNLGFAGDGPGGNDDSIDTGAAGMVGTGFFIAA